MGFPFTSVVPVSQISMVLDAWSVAPAVVLFPANVAPGNANAASTTAAIRTGNRRQYELLQFVIRFIFVSPLLAGPGGRRVEFETID